MRPQHREIIAVETLPQASDRHVGSMVYVLAERTFYDGARDSGGAPQWVPAGGGSASPHTHPASEITDFVEASDDRAAALIVPGSGIATAYDDAANTLTISTTGAVGAHTHTGSEVTDFSEVADDRIASLLVAGSGITLTYNDVANTLTVAATVPTPAPIVLPGWITGNWYGLQETFAPGLASPAALIANRLNYLPLAVPKAVAVDRIGIFVTTLIAASVIRLGIYAAAANGTPGTLLLDAGTVSSATTGAKEITISQSLAAGWYYLACVSGHGPSVNALASINSPNLIGQTNVGGSGKAGSWIVTDAAAVTALPTTFNLAGASGIATPPIPMVRAA